MAPPPARPIQFGPFLLDRKLADGGMAELFLARQSGAAGFEKQLVVKRILPALSTDAQFVDMFLNEARLAAQLSHPNVVQVHEAGHVDGQYYIAMEYIDGADLRLFYDEAETTGRPTAPGIACRIVADLLAGLHYAHTRTDEHGEPHGIVHRDVSPQNVLVTRGGTVKIVDFGIAKATRSGAQLTRAGQVKGKISYLSPEQAMGRPLDARSDVFACGILLWELVTGERLFSRPNDMAAILAITEDPIALPRSVRPDLPEALDRLVGQALARPLPQRFASAQAMQAELEGLIRSQGWAGDRRALERHMVSRLSSETPQTGAPTMPDRHEPPPSDFVDAPTMLADAKAAPPSRPAPSGPALPPVPSAATVIAPAPTPSSQATVIAQMPVRTPPGMAPVQVAYPTPIVSFPVEGFGAPVTTPGSSSTARRVIVALTAALLVSIAAIVALDWGAGGGTARLLLTAAEPVVVLVDGKRVRVDRELEVAIGAGRPVTVTATTLRGQGKDQTRTFDVPPALADERVPLRITFQP